MNTLPAIGLCTVVDHPRIDNDFRQVQLYSRIQSAFAQKLHAVEKERGVALFLDPMISIHASVPVSLPGE